MRRRQPRSTLFPYTTRFRSTTSTGTISESGGVFTVSGSHTYSGDTISGQSEGSASISVTISHDSTTPQTVTDSATIVDPDVTASGGFSFTTTEGLASIRGTVASFS